MSVLYTTHNTHILTHLLLLLQLINMCWTFSPQIRLTFDRIKKQLREINPSNTSAIDNMMHMVEYLDSTTFCNSVCVCVCV